jgi:hypothetical protein
LELITLFFELLPFIFCLFFLRKRKAKNIKVFFIYTIVVAIFAIFGIVGLLSPHVGGLFKYLHYILFSYDILIYTVVATFLYYSLINNRAKKILLISSAFYYIFFATVFFKNIPNNTYSTFPAIFEYLILIVFLVYLFYEKMQTVILYPIYLSNTFWIAVGLLLFFSGNFFYIMLIQESTEALSVMKQLKVVFGVISIMKNIILSLALLGRDDIDNINGDEEASFELPDNIVLDDYNSLNFKNDQ